MTRRWIVTGMIVIASGLGIGGCRKKVIDPPVPVANGVWRDTLPPLTASEINTAVSYDLAGGLRWLETQIPTRTGDLETKRDIPGNDRLKYAYIVERDPFGLEVVDGTATLTAFLHYQGRGWYNPPVLPTITASCGIDVPHPRARVIVKTRVSVKPNWKLVPTTHVETVEPFSTDDTDRCKVTMLKVDVTDKIMAAAKTAMEAELGKLDKQIARFDLRSLADSVWHGTLLQPIRIEDSLWLLLQPSEIRVGPINLHGTILGTTLGLSANPIVVSGPRPEASTTPLPPLTSKVANTGLRALLEANVTYDDASRILTRELKGTKLNVEGHKLVVTGLRVLGVGDGRAAIGLGVEGAAKGTMFLVGTPQFDADSSVLTMPDLAFDVGTEDLFVAGLAWLKHTDIEAFMRTKVRIRIGPVIDKGRLAVEKSLNRTLADGLAISSKVEQGKIQSVDATPNGLRARAQITGQLQLKVTLAPKP